METFETMRMPDEVLEHLKNKEARVNIVIYRTDDIKLETFNSTKLKNTSTYGGIHHEILPNNVHRLVYIEKTYDSNRIPYGIRPEWYVLRDVYVQLKPNEYIVFERTIDDLE